MTTWIDFKDLRNRLDFAAVLLHYGVEPKLRGRQHHGFCPLPTHDGKRRSPSFSANLDRKIWQCFGCGARGNVIDFAVRMEGKNPESGEDVRAVALKLSKQFLDAGVGDTEVAHNPAVPAPATSAATQSEDARPRVVNPPLTFELKDLDQEHPYLAARGFTGPTVAYFRLGYCARGLMKGRIAIPLYDAAGQLVGYAGRLVDDSQVGPNEPKYRFPSQREHKGTVVEFHKSLFLYNGNRIRRPCEDLLVVEGFPSVWWLWQNGWKNVVALMGAACSDAQANLIAESMTPHGYVWVVPDADAAGARCAESVLTRVARQRFVRWIELPDGRQPTDLTAQELRMFLPQRSQDDEQEE